MSVRWGGGLGAEGGWRATAGSELSGVNIQSEDIVTGAATALVLAVTEGRYCSSTRFECQLLLLSLD